MVDEGADARPADGDGTDSETPPRLASPLRRLAARIVDADGGGFPATSRAFVRWLVPNGLALLPLFGWLLQGIAYWLLVDAHRQAWHDKAASTIVVTAP